MNSSTSSHPRWATERNPERKTLGGNVAKIAEVLGQPLMPWQRLVADVGLELLPDGRPAYREIIAHVPRQSGKTTLTLALEIQRAIGWNGAQRISYSAQTGLDARRKLLDDQVPILTGSPFNRLVERIHRAQGSEAIVFSNGSRIDVLASTESAGHGRTLDLGIIDEAFSDFDDRREQAILPAMATRPAAQIVVVSTAGTDASAFLRRKVEAGRSAVERGLDTGIAYFEWSADEDADPDDPATWWACMPALGHTISLDVVAHARESMSDGDFRRSYLNQWTASTERVIPAAVWDAANHPDVAPDGRLNFALDVNPERTAAAIAVCSSGDNPIVEIIEHRPGVGWAVDRVAALANAHGGFVTIDAKGPGSSLIPDLERAGVRLALVQPAEVSLASMSFFDMVADSAISIRRHHALDAASASATRQVSGDSWRWARKGQTDITPLMAATLAVWSATKRQPVSVTPGIVDPWSIPDA